MTTTTATAVKATANDGATITRSSCCGQSISRAMPGQGAWSCDNCHAPVIVSTLSDYDRSVLAIVPRGERSMTASHYPNGRDDATHRDVASQWTGAKLDQPSAVVVYISQHDGSVQFGVARCCYPAGTAGETENAYEVSPFPGGWERVRESSIIAVRHTHAI